MAQPSKAVTEAELAEKEAKRKQRNRDAAIKSRYEREERYNNQLAMKIANLDEHEKAEATLEQINAENEALKLQLTNKWNKREILRTKRAYREKGMVFL